MKETKEESRERRAEEWRQIRMDRWRERAISRPLTPREQAQLEKDLNEIWPVD